MVEGSKNTEVGVIPEDWVIYKVNDLIELLTDFDANGSFASVAENVNVYDNDGFAWYVRSTDLEKNSKINEVKYVDRSSYKFLKKTSLFGGELLFLKRGDIGNVYLFQMKTNYATLAPNLYLLKLNQISSSTYLYYYFMSKSGQIQLKSKNASSTLGALYKSDVKSILVPLPPTLAEQTAIATALSDADALISSLEKLIAKKKSIRDIVASDLLSGRRKLSNTSDHWKEETIESLCFVFTKQTGFDYSAHIKPKLIKSYNSNAAPFIQNKDFNGRKVNMETDYYIPIDVAKNFPRILLDIKCLLISISGSIGNVGIFDGNKVAFLGGAIAVAKFKDKTKIDWAMYYLQSPIGQNMLLAKVKTGSHQNLILDDIRKMIIPYPAKDEMNQIISILSEMEKEIDLLDQKLEKQKQLKQGMMQSLLTGKIRLV